MSHPILGDIVSDELECINKANASPKVLAMDQLITKLNTQWRPTGYYTPDDLQKIINTLDEQAIEVGKVLAAAPLSTRTAESDKAAAFEDILSKYKGRGKYFAQAVINARAQGARVINAPGVKDWVISSMNAMWGGYLTAAMLNCQYTGIESVLAKGYNGMAAIGSVAASVVGVAADIAEGVYDATKDVLGFMGVLVKIAPYAIAGLGGYLAFTFGRAQYRRLRSKSEEPINWGRLFKRS